MLIADVRYGKAILPLNLVEREKRREDMFLGMREGMAQERQRRTF